MFLRVVLHMLKKWLLILCLLPASIYATRYYEECAIKEFVIIFYGNIEPEDEPRVRMLQRKYLEEAESDHYDLKYLRWGDEQELNALGIDVEVIRREGS